MLAGHAVDYRGFEERLEIVPAEKSRRPGSVAGRREE